MGPHRERHARSPDDLPGLPPPPGRAAVRQRTPLPEVPHRGPFGETAGHGRGRDQRRSPPPPPLLHHPGHPLRAERPRDGRRKGPAGAGRHRRLRPDRTRSPGASGPAVRRLRAHQPGRARHPDRPVEGDRGQHGLLRAHRPQQRRPEGLHAGPRAGGAGADPGPPQLPRSPAQRHHLSPPGGLRAGDRPPASAGLVRPAGHPGGREGVQGQGRRPPEVRGLRQVPRGGQPPGDGGLRARPGRLRERPVLRPGVGQGLRGRPEHGPERRGAPSGLRGGERPGPQETDPGHPAPQGPRPAERHAQRAGADLHRRPPGETGGQARLGPDAPPAQPEPRIPHRLRDRRPLPEPAHPPDGRGGRHVVHPPGHAPPERPLLGPAPGHLRGPLLLLERPPPLHRRPPPGPAHPPLPPPTRPRSTPGPSCSGSGRAWTRTGSR